MGGRVLSISTSLALASLAWLPMTAAAQSKTPAPLAGSKFVGVWQFNKDLSSPSPDAPSTTPTRSRSGGGGGRSGRGGGGGGFGGRGGRGGGPKIDATTKWDGVSLTQDLAIGQAKVTETYAISDDGNQLTETIKVSNGQAPSREIRHVFTRSS